ncbi:hypothetical protein GDO81_022926 [Engystomops pustulosus]|uniref:Uncharacterized protein n=1 Tax=Engystomops pustulosus TaxID=76066 RepID=A0AAV6YWC1_ENGPU|nr:hypothetical protein GDO81_022926 [Engystomops pustulosus]
MSQFVSAADAPLLSHSLLDGHKENTLRQLARVFFLISRIWIDLHLETKCLVFFSIKEPLGLIGSGPGRFLAPGGKFCSFLML